MDDVYKWYCKVFGIEVFVVVICLINMYWVEVGVIGENESVNGLFWGVRFG